MTLLDLLAYACFGDGHVTSMAFSFYFFAAPGRQKTLNLHRQRIVGLDIKTWLVIGLLATGSSPFSWLICGGRRWTSTSCSTLTCCKIT